MRRSWSSALGCGGLFAGSLALPGLSEREVVVPPVAASACALAGMGHAWFALVAVGARLRTRSPGVSAGLQGGAAGGVLLRTVPAGLWEGGKGWAGVGGSRGSVGCASLAGVNE